MDWPAGDVLGIRKGKRTRRQRLGDMVRAQVVARDGSVCRYCGVVCIDPPRWRTGGEKTGAWPDNTRTIEHVVPRSRGGKTVLENLVVACLRCNNKKGDRRPEEVGMRLLPPPTE